MREHALQQVRAAIGRLLTGTPGVQRVYLGRRSPIPYASLPAVNLRAIDETVSVQSIDATPIQMRACLVTLELVAKSADDVEAVLLAVQAEVEHRIACDPLLDGLVDGMELTGSRADDIEDDDAEYLIERRILTYETNVATPAGAPDEIIPTERA